MQFKIKPGINNCYLLTPAEEYSLEKLPQILNSFNKFSWISTKSIIIIEPSEGPLLYDSIFEQLVESIENGHLQNCYVESDADHQINEQGIILHQNLKVYLAETPVSDSSILILSPNNNVNSILDFHRLNPSHSIFQIDLDAVTHNLLYYQNTTRPQNKVMAMVKANAYGHGIVEIARHLKGKADYLGVAYVNEGIALRNANIACPVMVMNPSSDDLELCKSFDLEPEVHNLQLLKEIIRFTEEQDTSLQVQLELNTGMNRLGIDAEEVEEMIRLIKGSKYLKIKGLYSHLACAEDPNEDEFNRKQIDLFLKLAQRVESELQTKTIKHLRNSAGSLRYPDVPTDMIRLGIGLYGVDSNRTYQSHLKQVGILKTRISQIRNIKAGETIGYNRTFLAKNDMKIGTIAIGYADGFKRLFSNKEGIIMVKDKITSVVGRVNMDMSMIDLTGIDAEIGDDVLILSKQIDALKLAHEANTIPYEIFTSISDRVEREYLLNLD